MSVPHPNDQYKANDSTGTEGTQSSFFHPQFTQTSTTKGQPAPSVEDDLSKWVLLKEAGDELQRNIESSNNYSKEYHAHHEKYLKLSLRLRRQEYKDASEKKSIEEAIGALGVDRSYVPDINKVAKGGFTVLLATGTDERIKGIQSYMLKRIEKGHTLRWYTITFEDQTVKIHAEFQRSMICPPEMEEGLQLALDPQGALRVVKVGLDGKMSLPEFEAPNYKQGPVAKPSI